MNSTTLITLDGIITRWTPRIVGYASLVIVGILSGLALAAFNL